jgi:hypothetical protein
MVEKAEFAETQKTESLPPPDCGRRLVRRILGALKEPGPDSPAGYGAAS